MNKSKITKTDDALFNPSGFLISEYLEAPCFINLYIKKQHRKNNNILTKK